MEDPVSGVFLRAIVPELHFSAVIPDRSGSELYALATEDPGWNGAVRLVRIDARNGSVLMSRLFDTDFWRISTAPLKSVPAGDVRVTLRR